MSYLNIARYKSGYLRVIKLAMVAFFLPLALTGGTGQVAQAVDRSTSDEGYINPGPNSSSTYFEAGMYIIDAGAHTGTSTQTINQGLKPYGLVYALVKAKIPVQWVIKSDKTGFNTAAGNDQPDISSYDCDGAGTAYSAKNYVSGAFVVSKDFAAAAKPIIDSWKSSNAGLTVDGPCTNTPVTPFPVFATIKSWPRAVLDTQNGSVAVAYYNNAGISQGSTTDPNNPPAYRLASPSQLTPCDDMYIMPHADPTYATHSNLINFVKKGGDLYASCHAVSVLENIRYPAGHESATALAMNFLTTSGMTLYSAHSSQGSPAYTLGSNGTNVGGVTPGDPVAQFLGKPDLAMQQGSEQIFIPSKTIGGANSQWRPSTRIISYDTTQADTNGGSAVTNPKQAAAAIAYGPAWGDINAGMIMYQGGHSIAKGTADDVAAQRAFWNFQLLAAVSSSAVPSASDRTPTVVMTESATTSASVNSEIPVAGYAVGGSGSYKYSWASSCFTSGGVATTSGTFANASSASTTFKTPNVAGQINCNLTLTIIDTCGRYSFGYQTDSVAPTANVRIAQTVSGSPYTTASTATYTIVVTNDGAVQGTTTGDGNYASSVKVTGLIPAGATFGSVAISGSAPSGATCAQSMINGAAGWTCDLKDLNDEQSVTIVLILNPSVAGTLRNTVTANTLSYDSDLSDNVDSDAVTVTEDVTVRPSLSMQKLPAIQQAGAGGTASFKLSVTNTTSGGDIALTNIVLTDNFTTGGLLTCIEGGRSVFDAATSGSTYTIPSLARGATWEAACTISGVFASGTATTGSNTLTAAYSYGGTNYTGTSGAVTINKAASLQITKTEVGTLKPGSVITYKIRVYNPTGATATNVTLADTLPLGVTVESVTATNTNTTVTETATATVIAWDKFNSTSTTGQGFLGASWSTSAPGSSVVALSDGSNNSTGFTSPFTSERKSFMLKAAAADAPSIARSVTLSTAYKSVSVAFECVSQTSGATLKVSMAGTEIFRGTCTANRQQIIASVPSSVFASAGSKELKFEIVANTATGTKALFIDDVFVLGGYVAGDQFTGAYDSLQGMTASTWTETDSFNYLSQKSVSSTGTLASPGTSVIFKSSDSSNRQTSKISGTFYYDPARYAGMTIAFTCSHSKDFGDSDKLVLKIGTTTVRTEGKSTSYCEKGSTTPPSDSGMKLDTFTVSSSNLPTTAGNMTFTFEFTSKKDRDIAISDFFVLAREKGSSSVQITYSTLAQALAGPYTLAAGEAKEISYTVRVPNPYSPSFLTGLVNTASVKSDQMSNPAYSIISTPFAVSQLSVNKTSDKSIVASGGNVVYTYNVTNNGTTGVTIDTITVIDAGCSTITLSTKNGDTATVLGSGKTWTYTCTVTNLTSDTATVVTVNGVDNLGDTQTDDDVLPIKVSSPALTVSVSPTSKSIYAGSNVSYTYLVTNTGNVSLKNIRVTAANCPTVRYKSGDPNGDLELEAGDTWTFICTSSAISVSQTNQAVTAQGTDVAIGTVANSNTVNVAVSVYNRPVVTIAKTVKNTGPSPSGPSSAISVLESNTVIYEYTVTVETATMTSVRVNDTGCSVPATPISGDAGTSGTLEIGETWRFSCTAGKLLSSETSTATVTGIDALLNRVQSEEVSTYVEVVSPSLLLSVTPNKEYARKSTNVTYTYSILNIGGATFNGFTSVVDTNCALSLPDASTHGLAPGSEWTFTCTKAATGTSMLSQFNVTGTYTTAGGSQSYSAPEATYKVFVMDPAMTVQKLAQVYKGTSSETRTAGFQSSVTAAIGDTIVFKYIVTGGEGSVPEIAGINAIVLTAINDSDCLVSTFAQVRSGGFNVGDTNKSGAIDKDEPWEFTCTAKASVTSGSQPTNTPITSPVTLDAATTLETSGSGIGIRKGGFDYTPRPFSAQSSVTVTLVPLQELPSHKFTVAKAAAANVKSYSITASPLGKNLSETSSATITLDPTIQNYALTYNANGGSGTVPDAQYGSGNQVVSNAGSLTKSGFRFAGWYTNANRTGGTAYAVGSSFNLVANATLYAVWIANVTYDANGADTGTVGVDATEYIPGATVTITASSPTLQKTGATFAGWNTAADGSGTSYPTSGTFTIPGDVTLYAKWTVSLSYNVNGGTGSVPATTTQLLNATPTVVDKTPSMANGVQSFIGWNTIADGSGTDYFVGGLTDPLLANTILYAQWTNSPTYTITYLLESSTSGSVPVDPRNYLSGASATILTNSGSLARTSYTFNGWICNSINKSEGASLTIGSANIVCIPNWVAEVSSGGGSGGSGGGSGGGNVISTPTITFNPNYPGPALTTQSGSGTVTLLPNTYKRPGFVFKGWSKLATGPAQILDGGILAVTGDVMLYAVWEAEVVTPTPAGPVTITFNSNCSPVVTDKQINAGKVKLNSNTFTCSGSAFAGWSTTPNGAVEYLDQAVFNFAKPTTLYAVWNKNAVAPAITKGELRFEVFFPLNSVIITQAEKKNIAAQVAAIKKKAGSRAIIKVSVEGWVQPTIKTGNVEFLSKFRAKHVADLMKQLGLKATYKEFYKGLGTDNLPKMRHASVIVTWTTSK